MQRQTYRPTQKVKTQSGRPFTGHFQKLETRRLMSATTGSTITFNGGELAVTSMPDSVVYVELSQDGQQVRGVVDGQAGEWYSTRTLRRISVAGGDDVQIDSRLTSVASRFQVGSADSVPVTLLDADGNVKMPTRQRAIDGLNDVVPTKATKLQIRQAAAATTTSLLEKVHASSSTTQEARTAGLTQSSTSTSTSSTGDNGLTYGYTNVGNTASSQSGGNGDEDDSGNEANGGNNTGNNGSGSTGNNGGSNMGPGGQQGPGGSNSEDRSAPQPVINAVSLTVPAGQAFHADALATRLHNGQWNDATFNWNFGDNGSEYNSFNGFVGSHLYTTPGTYTVTLTVTDEAGHRQQATASVSVVNTVRSTIYVSATGDDANSGTSTLTPVRSATRALELQAQIGDHVNILFQRNQSHSIDASMVLRHDDIVVGAYGRGESPTLLWTGEKTIQQTFVRADGVDNVMVRDLTFKVEGAMDPNLSRIPSAVDPRGNGFGFVNNTLLEVGFGVRANGDTNGVLVQNNTSPTLQGLRNYFVWGEGRNITVLGNYAENSAREHVLRISENMTGITVHGNDFSAQDLRDIDPYDFAKAAINIQWGQFAYVSGNTIRGSATVGPLGENVGIPKAYARAKWVVWEDNFHVDSTLDIDHGSEHVDVRNNVFDVDGEFMIEVEGPTAGYTRTAVDITLHGNLGINNATVGQFIHLKSGVQQVEVTDNTYIAPNLVFGPYATSGMYIADNHMNGIVRIEGNTWPRNPLTGDFVQGGVNVFGGTIDAQSYCTPEEWNALEKVNNDVFLDQGNAQVLDDIFSTSGFGDTNMH